MIDGGYILGKNISLSAHYDTDMGFGGGLTISYLDYSNIDVNLIDSSCYKKREIIKFTSICQADFDKKIKNQNKEKWILKNSI